MKVGHTYRATKGRALAAVNFAGQSIPKRAHEIVFEVVALRVTPKSSAYDGKIIAAK